MMYNDLVLTEQLFPHLLEADESGAPKTVTNPEATS